MTNRTENTSQTPPDRDQLWAIYLKKNPHWASDGVHLTPEGLRKFVEQVGSIPTKVPNPPQEMTQ